MAQAEIHYDISRPDQHDADAWAELHMLECQALLADLTDVRLGDDRRTVHDAVSFARWGDPDRYLDTHLDPNLMVGNELNPDQAFWEPHVVRALDGDRVVGYLYTAMNVSGGGLAQVLKRGLGTHTYLWQRTIAVHPNRRNQGIATALERIELERRPSRVNTRIYGYPQLTPRLFEQLVDRGLQEVGIRPHAKPFGTDEEVPMHVMEANIGMLKRRGLKSEDEEQTLVVRRALKDVEDRLAA